VQRERLAVALVDTAAAARAPSPAPAAAETAAAVLVHSRALIDAAGPACVAVKPQLACFDRLGSAGWLALEATCAHAREAGLLVLADGKRGDVPVTALAYAQGLVGSTPSPFGAVAGLGVDALTANPLLGRDALAPLVEGARAAGAGVFVLVRTSNPGAADVMDLPLASGEPLWERLAVLARELGEAAGEGLADVGAVTGATAPEHLARMRELMPRTPFLLPGVGAQGGDVSALAPAFGPGRAAGLVTASRSIAGAHEQQGGSPAGAARAEAERLRAVAWDLA
jgi:orotidine-5'-phosphate decarboxylase